MIETDFLPLTETSFFIMLSLATSPKHGYAIIKEVDSLSEHRVLLATGTLYTALRRMLDEGWIQRLDDTAGRGLRQRKLYQLTDLGRRILKVETERLQKLVSLAQLKSAQAAR